MHTETDLTDRPAPMFASTGRRIVIGDNPNCGRLTFVYIPSAEACAWDGAVGATHCTGSRFGGYGYAKIEITGRADRYLSGWGEPMRRIRITLNVGTPDECTEPGWLVGGGTV